MEAIQLREKLEEKLHVRDKKGARAFLKQLAAVNSGLNNELIEAYLKDAARKIAYM
ncbi:MAG: hypothetical protein SVW57_12755 [Thermodesulfobacteriota bacterium]|nr:hypothetical protein [Thermodesulfobacteriota bacterium]